MWVEREKGPTRSPCASNRYRRGTTQGIERQTGRQRVTHQEMVKKKKTIEMVIEGDKFWILCRFNTYFLNKYKYFCIRLNLLLR